MAGIRIFEEQLRLMTPHTYNALTKLVMAMAKVANNAGKKSFFGRDKGQEAYSTFLLSLKTTLQAMILDGVIRESTPTGEVVDALVGKLDHFTMAFPNWQDAYGFGALFFVNQRADAVTTIERLRSMP